MYIYARATYHHTKNDTYFRSLYTNTELTSTEHGLKMPQITKEETTIFKDDTGWHTQLDVHFTVQKVSIGAQDKYLAVYPDFAIAEGSRGSKVELAKVGDWHVDPEHKIADAHYNKTDGEDWAAKAIVEDATGGENRYVFRLVFRDIDSSDKASLTNGDIYDLKYKVIAQYPFLVNYAGGLSWTAYSDEECKTEIANSQPVNVRRKAASADGGYAVAMSSLSLDRTTQTTVNDNLSGIIDAGMFGGDGEVELYNLQGIRVVGEPAPGIYLRRCGNSVAKVIVK